MSGDIGFYRGLLFIFDNRGDWLVYLLAIDESNHGRPMEVITAVTSGIYDDGLEAIGLAKIRKDQRSIFTILKGRDFKYTIVPDEYKQMIGKKSDHLVKVIAYAELIKSFYREVETIDKVLIDGDVRRSDLEKISELIPYSPKIEAVRYGDTRYPLINLADAVANKLYQHFKRSRKKNEDLKRNIKYGEDGRLFDHFVSLKLDNYSKLLQS